MAKAASGREVEPRVASLGSEPEDVVAPLDLELVEVLAPVKAELRCGECGYGIVATETPEVCPMCQASAWEPVPWRPFSRLTDFAGSGRKRRRRRSA